MRTPSLRFKLSSIMTVVAIVALSIGAKLHIDKRRARCKESVMMCQIQLFMLSPKTGGKQANAETVAYYSDLIQKYERAARYPWLPMPDDLRPKAW